MPAQVQKSGLVAKLGAKLDAAVKAHANDEIKGGGFGQTLPPGIRNGRAKLTDVKFELIPPGKANAGEYRFVAQAVALEPATFSANGHEEKIAGRQLWLFEPLCDTVTKTGKNAGQKVPLADHVANVMQHLGRLGAEFDADQGGVQLEAVVSALKSQIATDPIYFPFTTSPRRDQATGQDSKTEAWENWGKVSDLPDYSPPDATEGAVDDQSGEPGGEAPAGEGEQEVDLDALAAEADGMAIEQALAEDGPGSKIYEIAAQFGLSTEKGSEVAEAASWAAAVEIIKTAAAGVSDAQQAEEQQSAADAAPVEPEPWNPKKGDAVGYKAPVKNKTGKLVPGKVVQCEIAAVYGKNGTCDLTQLANKKVGYKGVKLDQLEQLS